MLIILTFALTFFNIKNIKKKNNIPNEKKKLSIYKMFLII